MVLKMKVLMTGGGTGGHVYPAIAIANTIKQNIAGSEIAFVGTPRGIENKICKNEGYPVYHVEVMGISRSLSPRNIKAMYLALTSPTKAKKIINEFKPDVVIGTGGYVSWPILVAAAKSGIPTLVHESNVYPGLAVRKLQRYVDKVLLNFEDSKKYLKSTDEENLICVGNPLRKGFATIKKDVARRKLGIPADAKVLLSYGGSRGAGKINQTIVKLMKEFDSKNNDVVHIHATGDIGKEEFDKEFLSLGLDMLGNVEVHEYINDMPTVMAAADLVICRAGAMTLSEIAMMKKAAIFIPSPNVVDNHQYKNAKLLADKNAAVVIEEKDLTVEGLTEVVAELLRNDAKREAISENVGGFVKQDANKLIYDEIVNLVSVYEKRR
jgi:UDP-N-acetylglucosamine--N-acetylmuramyl-(pentapeptide) pyrophosphoryl-undecaprenol N-acetylglucosamine transferase